MNNVNINGELIDTSVICLSFKNSSFKFGYGIFETLLVIDGVVQLIDLHWQRLYEGMHQLNFDATAFLSLTEFENEIYKTVSVNEHNQNHLNRVRIQVFAEESDVFGKSRFKPSFYIECRKIEQADVVLNEFGYTVGLATDLTKPINRISNLKVCNSIIYSLASQQAQENRWNDALLVNSFGNIIESSIANIFWIKDNEIYTPPLAEGCVAGTMRRHIMETTGKIVNKTLTVDELKNADEVFLTNAIKRIKWVSKFGDSTYNNEKTEYLHNRLFEK